MFKLPKKIHSRIARLRLNASIAVRLFPLMGMAATVSRRLATTGFRGLGESKKNLLSVYEDRMLPVQQLAEVAKDEFDAATARFVNLRLRAIGAILTGLLIAVLFGVALIRGISRSRHHAVDSALEETAASMEELSPTVKQNAALVEEMAAASSLKSQAQALSPPRIATRAATIKSLLLKSPASKPRALPQAYAPRARRRTRVSGPASKSIKQTQTKKRHP